MCHGAQTHRHRQYWNRREKKIWIVLIFCVGVMLYASRTAMPVCAVSVATELQLSKTQIGMVLSSFFWGYITTQIIGGHMADRYGGEYTIMTSMGAWSLLTFLTPFLIRWVQPSHALLCALIMRFLTGCFQGFFFPSLSSIFSHRVPQSERAFSYSFAVSGSHIGTVLSGVVGSLLNNNAGWNYTFIIIGSVSFMVFLVFFSFNQATFDHKRDVAGKEEMLHYYTDGDVERLKHTEVMKTKVVVSDGEKEGREEWPRQQGGLQWCALFYKVPFWALLIASFCSGWQFYIILSWLSTYFSETFPHSNSTVFNTIPWIFGPPCQWLSGWMADTLIRKGFSTTFVRKFIQSIAFLGSAVSLLLMSHSHSYISALVLMTLAINFSCFHYSGLSILTQDIAPSFAGVAYGVQNMAGSTPGFLGVYVTGYILEVTGSWTLVFDLTSAILFFGCFVFVVFGTGKRIL